MKYLFPLFALVLIACSGGSDDDRSDDEKMRDEVRSYLMLDDSVAVAANIVDTILVQDLDGMMATVEQNLKKIQWDIDTLNLMMDEVAYDSIVSDAPLFESVNNEFQVVKSSEFDLLKFKLKMADLQAKKLAFQQSKRVMLHLRRAQLNTIAGYEVSASFNDNGENVQLGFLMTPEFRIVD